MKTKCNPFLILIVLLMCVSLFGCSPKEPGRYYDNGFSIKVPEGWEAREVDAPIPGLVVYIEDPKNVAKVAIFETEFEQEVNYDEYIQGYLNRLKSSGGDLEDAEELTIDGSKAHRVILYNAPTAKITLSYTIIKDNKAYGMGFTIRDPELFSSYEDTFDEVALSFRFE